MSPLSQMMRRGYAFSQIALSDTNAQPCELHPKHAPKNLTVEFHHIVPVAWQLATTVPAAEQPSPGPDTEGRGMLWDDRGAWCCPTGHRNVHHLIVMMMTAMTHYTAAGQPDPQLALPIRMRRSTEGAMALLAIQRLQAVGGVPYQLAMAGLLGNA